MASNNNSKKKSSTLIGAQVVPTVLNSLTNIGVDTTKTLVDNIILTSIGGGLNVDELSRLTMMSTGRDQIYQLIDTMCQDSTVSAIVRTYAEDVCEPSDNGHIVWCESDDSDVSKFVNYLLDVMNVDKNIFTWVYHLIKYGDVYLRLFRESDYADAIFDSARVSLTGRAKSQLNEALLQLQLNEDVNLHIRANNDRYSHYVEMVLDPGTMFELTKFGKTYGYVLVPTSSSNLSFLDANMISNSGVMQNTYRMRTGDINIHQADDFVHACLDYNLGRTVLKILLFTEDGLDANLNTQAHTYSVKRGKSMLADSYKIWREKALLLNSALLNRITKSSIVRTIMVEVGDMSKEQVQLTLRRVKELMEQKSAVNTGTSMNEYPNAGPIENNIYLATHNGQGAVNIGTVGGDVDVKNLADLDWWNNKFYSSYGIPKQFMGWTEDGAGFNGGQSLSIISSIYAKGVKRIQNAMLQALTDAINLFFLDAGNIKNVNKFVLKMRVPVTQEEIDYRSSLTNKISAISNFQALLTDIEDKPRRLEILKALVSGLEYGDEILIQIEEEILAVKKKQKELELAANALAEGSGLGTLTADTGEDLLPPMTESLMKSLVLSLDAENLPSPEELDDDIDFTKNV